MAQAHTPHQEVSPIPWENSDVGVFCTGKIWGGQDRVFLFCGGLENYEELQSTL
jgi:hypothetical protein